MNAMEIVRQWTCTVKGIFCGTGGLHAHQAKALAAVSCGMALCGHCDSGHLSAAVPTRAKPASVRRRVERLLTNGRLPSAKAMGLLSRSLLDCWAGRPLVLILDETPNGEHLRCLRVSAGYRKRAVPLAWECYRSDDPPVPMPKLVWRLLGRVARCLARALPAGAGAGAEVTLLADRGLSWPTVLDCCRHLGWHYVLRLQGSTRVRTADGRQVAARDLAPCRGARWFGSGVEVFKKAGWRRANVAAAWEEACREPWLLATDLPASFARCRGYCRRCWCEQMHRDEKSQGFNWQRSLVRRPAHARRLLLAMALATLLAVCTGTWVLKRGLRRLLESTRRRKLSVFQLGLRWLGLDRDGAPAPPCSLYLYPA